MIAAESGTSGAIGEKIIATAHMKSYQKKVSIFRSLSADCYKPYLN